MILLKPHESNTFFRTVTKLQECKHIHTKPLMLLFAEEY
jgi:hypothetical protein